MSPTDTIRNDKKENDSAPIPQDGRSACLSISLGLANHFFPAVDPYPAAEFKAGQKELAQDLILKEQQIEYLISSLPGLDNSEEDQEKLIRQLEEELKVAEEKRKEAVNDKEEVLAKLDEVIRSVKRP